MCSYAQTKRYYCEVKGIEKELSSGLKIIFDFGNQVSHWDRYLGMITAMTQVPVPTTTHVPTTTQSPKSVPHDENRLIVQNVLCMP
jgi:hypothetical protein